MYIYVLIHLVGVIYVYPFFFCVVRVWFVVIFMPFLEITFTIFMLLFFICKRFVLL